MGAGALLLAASVVVHPVHSEAASTFSASAGGEVVRSVLSLEPALLAEEILDPGALTAQASLTSFGESLAFASNPYPGAVPVSAPGLIDGVLASTPEVPPALAELVNLPDYPLIASSSYPGTPSSTVTLGPLSMDAQSRARESSATATDGANRTEARVMADDVSDDVTARATTTLGALDLGPLVQVAGVRSAAMVTQAADGELDRSTEFSVASLSILGNQIRVTDDGMELAGVNLPGGLTGVLDPVQQLLSALAEQGTSVRFVESVETPEGVISAGLVVESRFDTGINGIIATVTKTFGRTFASVSNAARPGLGGDTDPVLAGPSSAPGSVTGLDPGAVAALDLPSAVAAAGPARPADAASAPRTEQISSLVPDRTDAGAFYPVIALGGAVLVVGITLFRKIGVRSAWTS